jgi:hypothetical protein
MKKMILASLLTNVLVLIPICVGLFVDASWVADGYGAISAARSILLSIYVAILVVSIGMLIKREPMFVAPLLLVQVVYTMSVDEVRAASRGGYRFEGIAFYSKPSVNSVHRLYNPSTGQHFYSASVPEVNYVKERLGYNYEGIAFTAQCIGSCETKNSINVHRFKKPLGHFWSTSGN